MRIAGLSCSVSASGERIVQAVEKYNHKNRYSVVRNSRKSKKKVGPRAVSLQGDLEKEYAQGKEVRGLLGWMYCGLFCRLFYHLGDLPEGLVAPGNAGL